MDQPPESPNLNPIEKTLCCRSPLLYWTQDLGEKLQLWTEVKVEKSLSKQCLSEHILIKVKGVPTKY